MIKTCYSCSHYHGLLTAGGDSFFHIHDYCDKFNMALQRYMESEVNSFLDQHWEDTRLALKDSDFKFEGLYDDFETCEAYCWRYEPISQKQAEDVTAEYAGNREYNRQLAILTLEHILKTGRTYITEDEYETVVGKEACELAALLKKLKGEAENGD